jgi:hypothetical protein
MEIKFFKVKFSDKTFVWVPAFSIEEVKEIVKWQWPNKTFVNFVTERDVQREIETRLSNNY